MLIARKQMSIGSFTVAPGDIITDAMRDALPPNRIPQLRDHGWLEERTDNEALSAQIDELRKRVEALESQFISKRPKKGPGRPPKRPVETVTAAVPHGGESDGDRVL